MKTQHLKRLSIVHELATALSQIAPITLGYSGSLANGNVNEFSDIDLLIILPEKELATLIHQPHFRKFFQLFPLAPHIIQDFMNHKIDVFRASGCLDSVRLNCEIYAVESFCKILSLVQPQIKVVRKVMKTKFLRSEWYSLDNLGSVHIIKGRYKKYYDSLLLTRDCVRISQSAIALGPDLDRILSAILVIDQHRVKLSIINCWKKIFSIINTRPASFQNVEFQSLSRLFYNPPSSIPVELF